jgi:hypothetical protein
MEFDPAQHYAWRNIEPLVFDCPINVVELAHKASAAVLQD